MQSSLSSKNCILLNFTFNSCQNLSFQSLEEDCQTLKVLKIRHANIAITQVLKRNASEESSIFNLRNLAFYNFSQNLGFQPLEKDLTTLQLLRTLHGTIMISKFVRRTTARAIFRKFSILRNFVFYNFCQNLGIQL